MFYTAQDFGAATGNISCCSGAPVETAICAAEAQIGFSVAHSFDGCNGFFALAQAIRETRLTAAVQTARLAAGS